MKHEGGWVFISHSHFDIEIVRRIRNYLEDRGFEPLLFYLKCLSDDDEIEDLIRREIDEREWFIYIDSENSRGSRWVQSEREYIKSRTGKKVFTIDLSKDLTEQLRHIASQMQVYVSYSPYDAKLAKLIADRLAAEEMLVLTDADMPSAAGLGDQIKNTVAATARCGFVVLLVTEHTGDSKQVENEIRLTVEMGGRIVPVYVDDATLSPGLLELAGDIRGVHMSSSPTEDELLELIDSIMTRVEYYSSDFTALCGFQSAVTIEYPHIGRIEDYTFWDCPKLREITIPPAVQFISELAFRKDQDVLIKCKKGSYAERFCIEHGMRFELID